MKRFTVVLVSVALLVSGFGCASMKKRDKGAIIGATAGAVVGGVIGKQAGNTAIGAILGAAIGGAAGMYIGNYMDKQAEEMKRDLEGAQIERVGEGIKITFNSGILFDVNKAELRGEAKSNIDKLAVILNKYPDTKIVVEGHTDADGTEEYNLKLSQLRAQSVANEMSTVQVDPTRFTIMGYGESQPVGDNATTDGKQANRRVEIAIFANDKLKDVAKQQAG
ncbi:MAG: OmpA family protein [candidate division Zixibacteria bacterium]|nr:OmpA family protein [candidate division Zixibacteria bacterium]